MADFGPLQRDAATDPNSFDVPEWLTGLTGIDGWVVDHTHTRHSIEFVASYAAPDGATAEVTLKALPDVKVASWEVLAALTARQERIVIPARTRIKW
jgi:hypothetical protein